MGNWADFLISEVCYDDDHSRIIECHIRTEIFNSTNDKYEISSSYITQKRIEIVENLKKQITYKTIYQKEDDKTSWYRGDEVIFFKSDDGELFIRTDGNKIKQDNLGNLPEY